MASVEKQGCLPKFLQRLGLGVQDTVTEELPYRLRDDFLSVAEASFLGVLKIATGEQFMICPKVSLRDLFFVAGKEDRAAHTNRIARKHIDFLLCDPTTFKPQLGIELDDASHKRPDRADRDSFVNEVFKAAQLPLLRIPVRAQYDVGQIEQLINQSTSTSVAHAQVAPATETPTCPKCGISMILRTATRGENKGHQFYGCSGYPKCKQIVEIAPAGTK